MLCYPPHAEPLLDHMLSENIHHLAFPLIPDKKPPARAGQLSLGPRHHWRDYPQFRERTHSLSACLLLLRDSKKPSFNYKSGLIILHATNSQHYVALPTGEGLVQFSPTLQTRGRGYFRATIVIDSIGLQSLASHNFPRLPLFSSVQPMLELFPGLDYSLAISCCRLQQDSTPLLTARQI